MAILAHPDAVVGMVLGGAPCPPGVREQTSAKGDSLFGLFRARLDELAAALKSGDSQELALSRSRVVALLRMRELPAERAAKRVTELEAALQNGTPPERLVPSMPARGSTVLTILRDTSLELSKAKDPAQPMAQRARNVLLATLEACGLDAAAAAERAQALAAAWTR